MKKNKLNSPAAEMKKILESVSKVVVQNKAEEKVKRQKTIIIEVKAYEFWEKQGKKIGNDKANWLEAEKEVSREQQILKH